MVIVYNIYLEKYRYINIECQSVSIDSSVNDDQYQYMGINEIIKH